MSKTLLCPYCIQVYVGMVQLSAHVHRMHREDEPNSIKRATAAANARVITDVAMASPAALSLQESLTSLPEDPRHRSDVLCVCGEALTPLDSDTDHPLWTHLRISVACKAAIPAAGLPTQAERAATRECVEGMTDRLGRVGQDLMNMRSQLQNVQSRLARLAEGVTDVETVRQATLSNVLDKLLDAGDMVGYKIVSQMLTGRVL